MRGVTRAENMDGQRHAADVVSGCVGGASTTAENVEWQYVGSGHVTGCMPRALEDGVD